MRPNLAPTRHVLTEQKAIFQPFTRIVEKWPRTAQQGR
jgi:hypothetical protein